MRQLEMVISAENKKTVKNRTSKRLIRVNYLLSEDGREAELYSVVSKGMLQSIQVEAEYDEIAYLEECKYDKDCYNIGFYCIKEFMNPIGEFEVTGIPTEYYGYDEGCRCCTGNLVIKFFSKPMTFEELLFWERNRQTRLKQDEGNTLQDYYLKKFEWNKEMINWTKEYGSNSLKNLSNTTSQADILYIYERAQRELPGFEIISREWLEYKVLNTGAINIPNIDAIGAEIREYRKQGYDASIKNLINDEEDKLISAIFIENYLGKNTLMKRIDELI
ncbi:hypothetical protein EV204_101319 [Tissierella praeacuta]|uniref:hypothetical protein n=1 Tax=Tissierella praeacuta TaxID=43131 RepID=UPI001046ADAE|nr:hypothetical protein [Tissierella praeacuta]TCU79340.1 hypothetical protein EV204_101319 [Tissierella praeacuta]